MDTAKLPIIPAVFCVIIVFTLSFGLINLLLAVILESYVKDGTKYDELQH